MRETRIKQIQEMIKQNKKLMWKHVLTKTEKKELKISKVKEMKSENENSNIAAQIWTRSPQRGRSPIPKPTEGEWFLTEKFLSNSKSPVNFDNQITYPIKDMSFALTEPEIQKNNTDIENYLKKILEENNKADLLKFQITSKNKDQEQVGSFKFKVIENTKISSPYKSEKPQLSQQSKWVNTLSDPKLTERDIFEKIIHNTKGNHEKNKSLYLEGHQDPDHRATTTGLFYN